MTDAVTRSIVVGPGVDRIGSKGEVQQIDVAACGNHFVVREVAIAVIRFALGKTGVEQK